MNNNAIIARPTTFKFEDVPIIFQAGQHDATLAKVEGSWSGSSATTMALSPESEVSHMNAHITIDDEFVCSLSEVSFLTDRQVYSPKRI